MHNQSAMGAEFARTRIYRKLEVYKQLLQDYQKKGFRTSVLKHLLEEAKAKCVDFAYLITDSGYTAKEMYEKCNFKKVGRYYTN